MKFESPDLFNLYNIALLLKNLFSDYIRQSQQIYFIRIKVVNPRMYIDRSIVSTSDNHNGIKSNTKKIPEIDTYTETI